MIGVRAARTGGVTYSQCESAKGSCDWERMEGVRRVSTGAQGMVTLRKDGRRGRVTTGVGAWEYDEDAADVRAARIDSGAALER